LAINPQGPLLIVVPLLTSGEVMNDELKLLLGLQEFAITNSQPPGKLDQMQFRV
jgi:hypothetical protein